MDYYLIGLICCLESCFEDGWDVVDYDKKVTASLVIEQPLTLITGYGKYSNHNNNTIGNMLYLLLT